MTKVIPPLPNIDYSNNYSDAFYNQLSNYHPGQDKTTFTLMGNKNNFQFPLSQPQLNASGSQEVFETELNNDIMEKEEIQTAPCLLYTSPSPRD